MEIISRFHVRIRILYIIPILNYKYIILPILPIWTLNLKIFCLIKN